MTDPWDELQQAIGLGWPHYKKLARPLIKAAEKRNHNLLPFFLIFVLMRGALFEYK